MAISWRWSPIKLAGVSAGAHAVVTLRSLMPLQLGGHRGLFEGFGAHAPDRGGLVETLRDVAGDSRLRRRPLWVSLLRA